jgi:hypothetical protein
MVVAPIATTENCDTRCHVFLPLLVENSITLQKMDYNTDFCITALDSYAHTDLYDPRSQREQVLRETV